MASEKQFDERAEQAKAHLQNALAADDASEKNFHIRAALQELEIDLADKDHD